MDIHSEPSTPFDFDLEIWGLWWNLKDIFGDEYVEQQDVKDMFHDFAADKMLFVQIWDTINYHIEENSDEEDTIYDNGGNAKTYFGSLCQSWMEEKGRKYA